MKYEFHVGDYVENRDGDVGYIEKICDCEYCKARGFFEPYIRYKDGSADYLTIHEAERVEQNFKRIGKYDFTKPEHSKEIEKLDESWFMSDLVKKVNELVDAVNGIKACER